MPKNITPNTLNQARIAAQRYDRDYLHNLLGSSKSERVQDIAQLALAMQAVSPRGGASGELSL